MTSPATTTASTSAHNRPRGLLGALTLAVVIGLVSLVLAVQNAVALSAQSDRRETERVASDYSSCLRGNTLRQQLIDLGRAEDELVTGILDTVLPSGGETERAQAIAAVRARLDPQLEDYRSKVAAVGLVNCDAAVPGGRSALERTSR